MLFLKFSLLLSAFTLGDALEVLGFIFMGWDGELVSPETYALSWSLNCVVAYGIFWGFGLVFGIPDNWIYLVSVLTTTTTIFSF